MANGSRDLYSLLPAVYRERDAQRNLPLRALLSLLEEQRSLVDRDIARLQENSFIETCDEWVIAYIADLVSNNLLFDPSRSADSETATALFTDLVGKDLRPPVAVRIRADVAKTIHYRRRKATPTMLEELARDVTGWPTHVVEFFHLLGWTQFLEHQRPQCTWGDLRSIDTMERVCGAFDQTMHTVDVRQPSQQEGWHNVRNVGFFVWRLQSFPLVNVPARPTAVPWRYHFSPLGNAAPLFSRPREETESLVTEYDVPAPIRRTLLEKDLHDYAAATPLPPPPDFTRIYGAFSINPGDPAVSSQTSVYIRLNGNGVDPAAPNPPPNSFVAQVVCRRLDPWPATQPAGKIIAIDVASGRLAVGDGWGAIGSVDVSYWYGFASGLGGGTYDRRQWLENPGAFPTPPKRYTVQQNGAAGTFASVTVALTQWQSDAPNNAIISILDNRTYALPATITLPDGHSLAIEAAQGTRPLLQAQTTGGALAVDVSDIDPTNEQRTAVFTLNGVVLEGFIHVVGDLGKLRLLHATLMPGRQLDGGGNPLSTDPSVSVEPKNTAGKLINLLLRVEAAFSILGALAVPQAAAGIWLLDCIVQGTAASPLAVFDPAGNFAAPLVTERSTYFGSVQVKSLQASEAIFTAPVTAQRTQQGCARFSYVPPGSVTPRRFRCQPDIAVANAIAVALQIDPLLPPASQQLIGQDVQSRLVPSFTTTRYGQPAFAQLRLSCPVEIRTGAEDGSEMGTFCHLKQPQRESNLKIRLKEYLPFGLEPAVVYVT